MTLRRYRVIVGAIICLVLAAIPLFGGCSSDQSGETDTQSSSESSQAYPSDSQFEVKNVFDEMVQRPDALVRGNEPSDSFTDVSLIPGFTYELEDKEYSGEFEAPNDDGAYAVQFRYLITNTTSNSDMPQLQITIQQGDEDQPYMYISYHPFDTELTITLGDSKEVDLSDGDLEAQCKEHMVSDLLDPYFQANSDSAFSASDYGEFDDISYDVNTQPDDESEQQTE